MNIQHLGPLPEEQEDTLEQMYQHHPENRCRQRAHMVLLSADGYAQEEIARIVRTTPKTVAKIRDFGSNRPIFHSDTFDL